MCTKKQIDERGVTSFQPSAIPGSGESRKLFFFEAVNRYVLCPELLCFVSQVKWKLFPRSFPPWSLTPADWTLKSPSKLCPLSLTLQPGSAAVLTLVYNKVYFFNHRFSLTALCGFPWAGVPTENCAATHVLVCHSINFGAWAPSI